MQGTQRYVYMAFGIAGLLAIMTFSRVFSGLFTVALNFGAGAFPGAERWLEIQVRTDLGAFSTLTPRQAVTPAPYAMFGTFDGPSGESCTAKREVSNTSLQALTMLNDSVLLEVAQSLAKRAVAHDG